MENINSLALLLDSGCPFSRIPPHSQSHEVESILAILNRYLPMHSFGDEIMMCNPLQSSKFLSEALSAILRHLANQRHTLLNIAIVHRHKYLTELQRDLDSGCILDTHVLEVYQTLRKSGVDVPPELWPGPYPSVYHIGTMTSPAAQCLHTLGFHDFNQLDVEFMRNGSPFAQACRPISIGLVRWFLDHGASAKTMDIRGLCTRIGCHFYGRGICIQLNRIIQKVGPLRKDCCQCRCSSFGCVPANYLDHPYSSSPVEARSKSTYSKRAFISQISQVASEDIKKEWLSEGTRTTIFSRLGLTHMCCRNQVQNEDKSDIWAEENDIIAVLETM